MQLAIELKTLWFNTGYRQSYISVFKAMNHSTTGNIKNHWEKLGNKKTRN